MTWKKYVNVITVPITIIIDIYANSGTVNSEEKRLGFQKVSDEKFLLFFFAEFSN